MIPVHRNENPFYFLECNWLLPLGYFPVLHLLVHFTFLVGSWYVFFWVLLWTGDNGLFLDWLVNDLNKIFDILILYLYKRKTTKFPNISSKHCKIGRHYFINKVINTFILINISMSANYFKIYNRRGQNMHNKRKFESESVSGSVISNSLWPHGLYHARLLRPPLSPGVCSNSCPWSQWCYLTISSSAAPSPFIFNLSQHQGLF